ncbi:MAG: hypothetical protein WBQ55_27175 [Xanthobacteraceae bacterium]
MVAPHDVDQRDFPQRIDRHVHRHAQIDAEFGEVDARLERFAERELGQGDQVSFGLRRNESFGHQHAVLGMAGPRKSLDTDELLLAQVDFRLIPEFDPVFGESFAEINTARERGTASSIPAADAGVVFGRWFGSG